MKFVLPLLASALLAGCVVQPYQTEGVAVVSYPVVETDYIWDPGMNRYYFVYEGQRRYMGYGWSYHRYGAPRGYWHGPRREIHFRR